MSTALSGYSETSDKGHPERGNNGQAESTYSHIHTLQKITSKREQSLSIKDKMSGPESVLIKMFHCTVYVSRKSLEACETILIGMRHRGIEMCRAV